MAYNFSAHAFVANFDNLGNSLLRQIRFFQTSWDAFGPECTDLILNTKSMATTIHTSYRNLPKLKPELFFF